MVRTLIPRGDSVSAKDIQASDTEKLFCFVTDFGTCGLTIVAQCPNVLAVNVSAGNAHVNGLYLCSNAVEPVACLAACMTNHIFALVARDVSCEPCAWSFTTNTTGCPITDAFKIGTAITNCATVTSVCNLRNLNAACGIPTGSMTMFAGTIATVPDCWLLANGASRNRITCAALFSVIGTQFGTPCCCTFSLPNLLSLFPRGAPCGCEPGGTGGADTVTLSSAQSGIVSHTHTIPSRAASGGSSILTRVSASASGSNVSNGTSNVAAVCSHSNIPAFLEMLYIIRQ